MMIPPELAGELGRSVQQVAVVFDTGESADKAAQRAVQLIHPGGAEAWSVRLPLPEADDGLGTWFFRYHHTAADLIKLIRKAQP